MVNLILLVKQNLKSANLRKKIGDDKLVVSLVLVAIGVILCYFYRENVNNIIQSAAKAMDDKLADIMSLTQDHK